MYPYIHIILPSYMVMALIGGFLSVCFIFLHIDKYEIEFTNFLKMFFFCLIGGIVGSKVLFAITQIPWLIKNFSVVNMLLLVPQSGFVFYGGLFGVIFTLMLLTRKDTDMRRKVFEISVPAMPLFHAFGRIGCFLAGCCYGKTLSSPIVVGPMEFTRIPVQLMESLAEFILFIVIWVISKRNKQVDLLKIYLVTYAVIRFTDEFMRGDKIRGIYFGVSTAQWISLTILIVYAVKYIKMRYVNHSRVFE
ncbi:prolipoprotein diacylglyceryl transferase [Eubacterium sp. MSJ-13]|uniref:prolipoprotein diacylglyceryl transferase n=1 Tax=Eubacterium sp. MSJ-13 TaxID=2841513 RepID=UPI001C10882C|nr:prolipoprotein diacylglyceryl transferase [Eubacterium sp. MSJ-13]